MLWPSIYTAECYITLRRWCFIGFFFAWGWAEWSNGLMFHFQEHHFANRSNNLCENGLKKLNFTTRACFHRSVVPLMSQTWKKCLTHWLCLSYLFKCVCKAAKQNEIFKCSFNSTSFTRIISWWGWWLLASIKPSVGNSITLADKIYGCQLDVSIYFLMPLKLRTNSLKHNERVFNG